MEILLAQATKVEQTAQQVAFFDPNYLNIQYFFNLVPTFFKWLFSISGGAFLDGTYIDKSSLENIFLFFSAILIWGIVFSLWKIRNVRKTEGAKWSDIHITALESLSKTEHNRTWAEILDRLDSFNESDWRRAILSADTMLDEMLEKMGYHGETIGERLKTVEESDFLTLDNAWEAHKVRNRIAHEGEFVLTKREARRVIDLYKEVFEEFHFI